MPRSLTRNLRRRGALPAAIAALGVGLWLLVARFLAFAVWNFGEIATPDPDSFDNMNAFAVSGAAGVAGEIAPIAIGVFASLWLLAPVAGELRLRFVIARSVLAVSMGGLLYAITQAAVSFAQPREYVLTQEELDLFALWVWPRDVLVESVVAGAHTFVNTLPIVVLAVVFLWLWLRDREPKHPVAGIIDEV